MKEEPRIMGQEVVEALLRLGMISPNEARAGMEDVAKKNKKLNEKAKPETMPALLPLGTKRKIILE